MIFGKKTVLPLSHGQALATHMSVFTETLNSLKDLELAVTEELHEVEEKHAQLKTDLSNVRNAIVRVKTVTG